MRQVPEVDIRFKAISLNGKSYSLYAWDGTIWQITVNFTRWRGCGVSHESRPLDRIGPLAKKLRALAGPINDWN
jgi:hypothetical protein